MEPYTLSIYLHEEGFLTLLPGMELKDASWRSFEDPDSQRFLQQAREQQVPEELLERVGEREFFAEFIDETEEGSDYGRSVSTFPYNRFINLFSMIFAAEIAILATLIFT
jgi:hypothetical protein